MMKVQLRVARSRMIKSFATALNHLNQHVQQWVDALEPSSLLEATTHSTLALSSSVALPQAVTDPPPVGEDSDSLNLPTVLELNQQVIASVQAGVIVYDRNLHYHTWNCFMEKLTGFSAEHVLGRHCLDVLPFLRDNGTYALLERALAGEKISIPDTCFTIPETGKSGWISTQLIPLYDQQGRSITGVLGILQDTTRYKEANDRFFSAALDLLCIANTDGYFLRLNPEWEKTLGYSLEELKSQKFLDFVHPEDLSSTLDAVTVLSEQKEILNFINRYRHRDGSYRWIEWRSLPVGNLIYAAARDITEQKQSEAALRQSEAKNRAMLAAIPDLLLRIKGDGTCLDFIPPSIAPEPGFIPVQSNITEILSPEGWQYQQQRMAQALETGELQVWEHQILRFGTLCDEEVRLVHCEDDEFVVIVRDITSRKRAEATLQESEERFRQIAETVREGFFVYEPASSRYSYVNPAYAALVGASPQRLYEQGTACWLNCLHPDDRERIAERLQQELQGEIFDEEYRFIHPGDRVCWVRAQAFPLLDDNGTVVRIVGTMQDITDRKCAEEALRKGEERWHLAIEGSNDGIWDHDLITGEHFLSPRCLEILGYDYSEVDSFEKWFEQIHPEDQPVLKTTFQAYLARQTPVYESEYRMRCKNGRYKWLLARGKAFWDETGTPVRAIGSITDITIRKLAETTLQQLNEELEQRVQQRTQDLQQAYARLQDSEARFQTFMNNSPTISWISNIDGVKVYVSQNYYSAFQLPSSEVIGKSISEVFPEDIAQQFLSNIQSVAKTNQILETIKPFPRPDGSMGEFLVYEFPLSDSSGQCLIGGIAIDITERRQAEEAIRLSQEQLQLAVEGSGDGLWDWNIVTGDTYLSPRWLGMLNYSVGEIASDITAWEQLIHPDDRPAVMAILDAHLRDGSIPYQVEFRARSKTGEWRWVLDYGKVVSHTPEGAPLRMVGLQRDITERKQAEVALQKLNAELEQRVIDRTLELQQAMEVAEAANRAKSSFLANMSHELRTPLNAILGFAQLMSHDHTLDPEHRQQLGIINRSGEHLLNLINDILEMSKIEAGQVSFNIDAFDLYGLLETLEDMFHLRASEKGLQLQFDRGHNVPQYIKTDENKLRQVLINLIGNAIKFTPKGSVSLHVAAECKSGNDGDSSSSPQSVILCFAVEDTGTGIDLKELERLFEPFVQSENRQIAQEGTGLGLSISRQFVKMMGGELLVSSALGQGSIFYFQVQVQLAEASNLPVRSSSQQVVSLAPNQPNYRILVVEDQSTNRLLLQQLLQSIGFEVQVATNGQEAIALWESWSPQLIWMDLRMPVLDGYEATQQIRNLEQQTRTRTPTIIIALTANVFEEERAKALDVGCNDFVRKPFQERELLQKMAYYLGVGYLYAVDQPEVDSIAPLSSSDAIAALQTLPASWLNLFHQATIQLDSTQLIILIEQIEPEQPMLAALLMQKLESFDLQQILDLLQEVKPIEC